MTDTTITARLEELRAAIHAENISWGELHELQGFGEDGHIDPGDVELREWAGLPEFSDDVVAECECCERTLPGAPGAGGASHLCNECGQPCA